MRFSLVPLTMMVLSSTAAAPTDGEQHGRVIPDHWARWELEDLEDINSTSTPLVARQQMRVCDYIITGAACYTLGSGLASNVKQLGKTIYDLSQGNSCGTFTGTVGAFTYRYRATGDHCDTTAQRATIEGGIMRHLESRNKQICGTECWDMSHGGTWDGYLAIGKTGVFDRNVYCGPHLSFADCTNGGKKDAP